MTDFRTYVFSRNELMILYMASAAAGLVISYLMYRNVIFAVIVIPFIPGIRKMTAGLLSERRRHRYMTEFKDFLFMISTAIGAGRSMKDAVGEAIPSLENIYGDRSVLTPELRCAWNRMETGGEADVHVLMDLARLSGQEDVYDFVTIYEICKITGASLITALNRAAGVIMDKMTIEREIEELVMRKKSEGMIIFVMPVIVILFLNIFAPDYISPLYETAAGRVIMTGVIGAAAGIYVMVQRITRIDI